MQAQAVWRALGNRNYRLLLIGQAISQSGGWMARIAQSWLVLEMTDSPVALGTVTTLQFLPILLLSLVAGALADHYPKRRVLLIVQSVSMTQAFALAVLVATGHVQLWHVYVLAMVQGTANAIEQPLRQAFPAELVGRELITTAIGLNSAVFNSARVLGPALGGLVVAVVGVAGAFALNGASFLAVVITLLLMRLAAAEVQPSTRDKNPLIEIKDALAFAAHERRIVFTLSALCCLGIFGFNYSTVLPLLARYELDLGASGYGTLSAALGVGSVLGALAIAQLGYRSPRRQVVGGLAFGVVLASIGLSPWLWLSLGLMGALGVAGVVFTTTANTTLQLSVPDSMRGRIMGLYTLLLAGMTPPGALATGFLAGLWGIRAAVAVESVICLAGVLAAFAYLVRSERRAALEFDHALA